MISANALNYDGIDMRTSLISILLILVIFKLATKNRKSELLSKIPGPKPYPFIGNALDFLGTRENFFKNQLQRIVLYGSIFRTSLGSIEAVHLADPKHIEIVLHSSKHLSKGFSYKFVKCLLGDGLITSSGSKWMKHRKVLTPAFHFKILDSFFDVFSENTKLLVEKLDERAEANAVFDVYPIIKYCTLDVICDAAMGVKVNALGSSTQPEYVQAVLRLAQYSVERTRRIWLHPDIIFNMTEMGKDNQVQLKKSRDFVDNVIQEKKKIREMGSDPKDIFGGKQRLAFLDLLLETAKKNPDTFTDQDIREEVDTFMFAGHDTTTAAITWALYSIGNHPKIQEKLYEEQRKIFQDDMERPITQEDISKMKYLDLVIKESLRLYPSVPFIGRTLDEDVQFGDYLVPKGTSAIIEIILLHRNPEIYPDPMKFDPDRFLPENEEKRHPYAYIPFSAGARNCIGKRFAMMEVKYVLSTICRRYELTSTQKEEELNLVGELILRPLSGIKLVLKKRNN